VADGISIGPDDIGQRVVIRRIVGKRDERPLLSDALGELVALTETEITVATERGALVVPLKDVTHAKRVPARRRPTAREVAALERVAAAGWPAPDTGWLGEWLLRAAAGWTSRANSALAVGDPGVRLADAITTVMSWYTERGLPPKITTPLPLSTAVAGALRARGWVGQPPTLVQTASLPLPVPADPSVRLDPEPDAAVLNLINARKGTIPAVARPLLSARDTRGGQVRFARGYAESRLVAIARGVVTEEWFGLSLVEVVPAARRQGWARRVTGALAAWAMSVGATRCYLQVEEHNEPAIALYADLGFTTHHHYITWRHP
jgi:ribosomal protein S18 acetylase RimI-like enzyme